MFDRLADNGSDNPTCSITSQLSRGFTGHEMLDSLCLINTNARLYDPSISRFMAADDRVSGLYATQAHNRFSYVANNPLAFTDPSGHDGGDLNQYFEYTSWQIENADAWAWREGVWGAVSWGDGGGGGSTHGAGQRGPEPYGAEGGDAGGAETQCDPPTPGVECGPATHAPWPVQLYPTILAYPAFLLPGGNSGGGGDGKVCPAGGYQQTSLGAAGTVALFGGIQANVKVGESLSQDQSQVMSGAQFFVSVQFSATAGIGAFAGVGGQISSGKTKGALSVFSVDTPYYGEAEAGWDLAGGASIQGDDNGFSGSISPPIPKVGAGWGAYAGAGRAINFTLATPQLFCR